jgi:anti-sigma factor RsiW
MKTNCFDIGIIQAFLDGELPGREVTRVSDHIGECNSCALLLAQAEDENAVVFTALAGEMDTLVPTQRLWTRIEDSIQIEKNSAPWWKKAYALVVVNLINPQIGALAALLIVLGLFAMYKLSGPAATNNIAGVVPRTTDTRDVVPVTSAQPTTGDQIVGPARAPRPTVENASYQVTRGATAVRVGSKGLQPAIQNADYVPGEESYVKTIASLNKSVNGDQDPNVMSASQQVSLARDMAVVDDTIKRMRDAVKKNPKNETAKQMLSSAYQNKIDLLNSVAQKEELVASLR